MSSPHEGTSSAHGWLSRSQTGHSDETEIPRPTRRRRSSGNDSTLGEMSQSPSSYAHPHMLSHSPPQVRSLDSLDALERQRTMDVESAMLLSRVRSGSIGRPHLPSHSLSPTALQNQHATPFGVTKEEVDEDFGGMLSKREEDEMTLARGEYTGSHITHDSPIGEELPETIPDGSPNILDSMSHEIEQESVKPPFYQSHARSTFDFSVMEQFAEEERARLGLSSPKDNKSGLEDLKRRLQRQQNSGIRDGGLVAQEGSDLVEGPSSRAKQRKLSESNSKPRTKSRKLALFEGDVGAPPPTLGYPSTSTHSVTFGEPPSTSHRPATSRHDSSQDKPYRFSFYSNSYPSTIHSRSICELPSENQSFHELFTGIPSEGQKTGQAFAQSEPGHFDSGKPRQPLKSHALHADEDEMSTWWLDVLQPSDEEMRMFSKVFSIHPLTTEDILMEETREKIELFRHYYLVCFRGFDQDQYSPTYLEPVNMYILVFREGILSFHFHSTPHPLNVRRRIKQLKDYISVTSDWISYALIDDITDAFGPLIQSIEYEVDSIDELVLILKEAEQSDMLRRIGVCRKKVMGLLRLMGNKADVVKGLAKRCNEQWSVAPKSDIGLYLSDIQDHLITMTQNLNHYEKILSRSHSNYLAQISIEMTDANNKINDVLSKLTALGTVLIPMNLITGLWGMNVHVPGQDDTGLAWFFSIVGVLIGFAAVGAFVTYRLMSSR